METCDGEFDPARHAALLSLNRSARCLGATCEPCQPINGRNLWKPGGPSGKRSAPPSSFTRRYALWLASRNDWGNACIVKVLEKVGARTSIADAILKVKKMLRSERKRQKFGFRSFSIIPRR